MGRDATEMVLKTSTLGTFRIFVVILAGFLASTLPRSKPLLTKEACRTSSRMCALLYAPSLVVFSLGSTLTPSTLTDSWQLIFVSGFTALISFATAGILGRVFLGSQDCRGFLPVQLAIAFQNSVSFPLLLVDALCQHDMINGDFDGESQECFRRATAMIFVYDIVWQIMYYGLGFPALRENHTQELRLTGASDSLCASTETGDRSKSTERTGLLLHDKCISNRSTKTVDVGFGVAIDIKLSMDSVGLGSGTQGKVASNGNASRNRENSYIDMHRATASMAAEDAGESSSYSQDQLVPSDFTMTSIADERDKRKEKDSMEQIWTSTVVEDDTRIGYRKAIEQRVRDVLLSVNIHAVFLGIVIALIPSLQEILFNNTQAALWPLGAALQTLGTPFVAVSTVVMAGSLVQVPIAAPVANGERAWRRYGIRVAVLHVGCRLIVIPAFGFALFWLAYTQIRVVGSNRLMYVIVLIQFAMPSTPMIIVSLHQLNMPATAGFMARLYVVQYGLSMITISAWTAVALRMVY